MNALIEAAKEVCDFMAGHQWRFCIIGGLAVQYWGEPRTTLDADITLFSGWGDEDRFVSGLLARFEPRMGDAHAFAVSRRILLIRASNGRDVDIALGALPFEESMMRRAVGVTFAPGCVLPCCSAEDLFVMKAFANRPRDWLDAESVVLRQPRLDKDYIMKYLAELCELKDAPDILTRAQKLLEGTA